MRNKKATIEKMSYSARIDFPCSETQLSKCLDVLNYLGKRMDGMDKRELNQFLAVNNSTGAFTGVLIPFSDFIAIYKSHEVSPLIFRERQYLFHALPCRL